MANYVGDVKPVRNENVVWRDVAGEVVIAQKDNSLIRVLNSTASLIWILADGSRTTSDIVSEVFNKFEVEPEQAQTDVKRFCQNLLEAGLVSIKDNN